MQTCVASEASQEKPGCALLPVVNVIKLGLSFIVREIVWFCSKCVHVSYQTATEVCTYFTLKVPVHISETLFRVTNFYLLFFVYFASQVY